MNIEKRLWLILIVIVSSFALSAKSFAQIQFSDPTLEGYVKTVLDIPLEGSITQEDADRITTLDCNSLEINSVDGLEFFTHLEYLYLSGNNISDITPLMKLRNLKNLSMRGNKISDAGQFNLTLSIKPTIDIADNCIQDFSPIDENMLEPVLLTGRKQQRAECEIAETYITSFSAVTVNPEAKEVEFTYRAWSSETEEGVIDFGDGISEPLTCDGNTRYITHNYGSEGPFTAKLKLNG